MLWVTRPHPHIDRTACAWLIRRFVDPEATFAFAPDREAAERLGGTPFDMRGVELGHEQTRCSFESILYKYHLTDPALHEMAAMVHDADLDDEKFGSPEAPGLDAVVRGLGLVLPDDYELLRLTDRLYDGLYAWVRRLAS
ncbi:MAG: chromate resistance protein [Gemmatimonadales bacterium]|nr:chromate resistance protein [Gemmatimonadales bacterium]MBA3554300.1 chromate resistance protein [Gemmatimonadales bacterium]